MDSHSQASMLHVYPGRGHPQSLLTPPPDRFGGWQKVLYAFENELDRRSPGRRQPRDREDPRNPLGFYVFQCGTPQYYIVYDSHDLRNGTKTPLPEGFTL